MRLFLLTTSLLICLALPLLAGPELSDSVILTPTPRPATITADDLEKSLADPAKSENRCNILLQLQVLYGNEGKLDKLADAVIRHDEICPILYMSDVAVVSNLPQASRIEFADILGRILSTRDKLALTKLYLAKLNLDLQRKDEAAKYLVLAVKAAWDDQSMFRSVWQYSGYNMELPEDMRRDIAVRMRELDPKDQNVATKVMLDYRQQHKMEAAVRVARDVLKDIPETDAVDMAAGIFYEAGLWSEAADAYKAYSKFH